MGGCIVEDAAWLRRKDDYGHINVAELDAVVDGINLALKWGVKKLEIYSDSATVCGWVKATLSEERRIRSKGVSEMIVKRRLGILKSLTEEFKLEVRIILVSTTKNKADSLTRVKKSWLARSGDEEQAEGEICCLGLAELNKIHHMAHMGVEKTLFLARKVDPTVTRGVVKEVVGSCDRCQSIDPAPSSHEEGSLAVDATWVRLAIDVTHYQQIPYLSIVDCGPGRLAIWKELRTETAIEIAQVLAEIFMERGPPEQIILDNSPAFRSELLQREMSRWNIALRFRAAYRPQGNGIVERNHRTIKSLAERGGISPAEAVFWYNSAPRRGQDEQSVPHQSIFSYSWRHPATVPPTAVEQQDVASVKVGDSVWVKPPRPLCTAQWTKGKVTKVISSNNVEVDGVPRHTLDIRKVVKGVVSDAIRSEHVWEGSRGVSGRALPAPQVMEVATSGFEQPAVSIGDQEELLGPVEVSGRPEAGPNKMSGGAEAGGSKGCSRVVLQEEEVEEAQRVAKGRSRFSRVCRPPVWTAD
ncbi:MAG: reverse transcriptase-like protein, partial [Bacteroidota bacterium]